MRSENRGIEHWSDPQLDVLTKDRRDLTNVQFSIPWFLLLLEGQPQLRLKLPVSSLVVRQVSEISRRAVDREYGRYGQRIWMVQHVSCVHPELDRFGFTNFETLADVCIEPEGPGVFEVILSKRALSPWFRVLEYDHSKPRIPARV